MTETRQEPTVDTPVSDRPPSRWVGWVLFASVMLFLVGAFAVMAGLIAIFSDEYYHVASRRIFLPISYDAWGWLHLGLAALLFVAGWSVAVSGKTWARVVAIAAAMLNAIASLAFMPAYPAMAVIFIVVDVLVIYAVAVHGRDVRYLH